MTLDELIDAIIQVEEELKDESIDYDKITALNSILREVLKYPDTVSCEIF